jgi:Histidine phosphatase superfamily (branch 1)
MSRHNESVQWVGNASPPPRRRFVAWLCLCACPATVRNAAAAQPEASVSSAAQSPPLPRRALLQALRNGGLVVYFRHMATDFSKNDAAMQSYSDCANQRLLTAQGRDDAARLGREIRALGLRISAATEVLASPMCRTMEHARLTFGRASALPELREAEAGDYPALKRLLSEPVTKGGNRWVVGHGNPFRAVAGPPHLAEGEAAIIRPSGKAWTVLARLRVEQWADLAAH